MCLYPVVLVHWLLNRTARRASLEYLSRLQARHRVFDAPPGLRQSLRHFASFAETLLDKLLATGGRYPSGKVRMQREVMLQQIASGQGGVIVTAHIGCLELCQALADDVPGFRLTALVHTAHAEDFNRLLRRLNPDCRVELLQVTQLDAAMAMELGRRVAAGEFVAIAGDRVPVSSARSVRAEFLGHPPRSRSAPTCWLRRSAARCSRWPAPMKATATASAFEQFSERVVLPRNARDAALSEQAARFAHWLEEQVRHAPFDWFNFFPFWDQDSHDASPR
jgi:predicted LPLAT superfamily acyltransferase